MKRRAFWAVMALMLILTGCARVDPYESVPNPTATITLEDGRQMRADLAVSCAPNTVANFVELANAGFYDGMPFFQVMPGCLVKTGDPRGDGTGDPGYAIYGEFAENGYERNLLSHVSGTLSMARQEDDPNSAGSQFFIMLGDFPEYDGRYAAFGSLSDEESLEVLKSICLVMTDSQYHPIEPVNISTIRVDTRGYEYEAKKRERKKEEKEHDER